VICGCVAELRCKFTNKDRFSNEEFKIQECAQCHSAVTEVPPGLDLNRYYPSAYYGDTGNRFIPIVEFGVRLFRKGRARLIQRFARNGTRRVLDIGCGRALMLQELQNSGWTCFGTEFSNESARRARSILRDRIYPAADVRTLNFASGDMAVVSLWQVFEHLTDPNAVLKEICRVLGKEGVLVLEVPNFSSWQARLGSGNWIYMEAPRHLYHFSPEGLTSMLGQHGFSIVYRSTLSWELGPFGMFQSLMNLFLKKPNFSYSIMSRSERTALLKPYKGLWFDILAVSILGIPALLIGTMLELLSAFVGSGGVIRLVAVKSS
jgi:SAM-dependent methyltransferase